MWKVYSQAKRMYLQNGHFPTPRGIAAKVPATTDEICEGLAEARRQIAEWENERHINTWLRELAKKFRNVG